MRYKLYICTKALKRTNYRWYMCSVVNIKLFSTCHYKLWILAWGECLRWLLSSTRETLCKQKIFGHKQNWSWQIKCIYRVVRGRVTSNNYSSGGNNRRSCKSSTHNRRWWNASIKAEARGNENSTWSTHCHVQTMLPIPVISCWSFTKWYYSDLVPNWGSERWKYPQNCRQQCKYNSHNFFQCRQLLQFVSQCVFLLISLLENNLGLGGGVSLG